MNTQISRYGQMLNFSIDSKTKVVRLEIMLTGETSPIVVTIERYRLTTEGNRTCLIVEAVSASREWINVVLNDFVKGRPIELPEKYVAALKLVM